MENNNIEFTVKKQVDGNIMLKKVIIVLTPILISAVIIYFFFFVTPVLLTLSIVGIWYFMRFTRLEYEYSIVSGEFAVAEIYDNKSRKDIVSVKIVDMSVVAPYEEEYIKRHLNPNMIKKIYDYHEEAQYRDFYFCVYEDPKMGKTAIIFNANRKMMQIMKFYNSSAVIMKNDFAL